MAQVLINVHQRPNVALRRHSTSPITAASLLPSKYVRPRLPHEDSITRWSALKLELNCHGRFLCLFSNGARKQEQARKALEGALGEKKSEFEKWNKEIEKRAERDGGGSSGRGGWFGGGGWFGWFNNEGFWEEAQQAILALLGILVLFLLLAKGSVMFALVFNSLLFVLRGTRNCVSLVSSRLPFKTSTISTDEQSANQISHDRKSAKDSVLERVLVWTPWRREALKKSIWKTWS